MAILKFVNGSNKSVEDVISYIMNPAKTLPNCIFGIGVNPFNAAEEFLFVQKIWLRSYKVKPYKQIIFSLDRSTAIEQGFLRCLFVEAGKCLIHDRRQVVGAIHFDTANIHCHYIINNIGLNGSCYRQCYSVVHFKERINELFRAYIMKEKIYFYRTA